jgi:hypothetical protein
MKKGHHHQCSMLLFYQLWRFNEDVFVEPPTPLLTNHFWPRPLWISTPIPESFQTSSPVVLVCSLIHQTPYTLLPKKSNSSPTLLHSLPPISSRFPSHVIFTIYASSWNPTRCTISILLLVFIWCLVAVLHLQG